MEREEQVRVLAYRLWEEEGKPEGRALEHWLKAAQMVEENKQPVGAAAGPSTGAAHSALPSTMGRPARPSPGNRGRRV
ncbi:MAG: DUF2934 domain-containing protein [Chloroflexi bacterium]|nr:DUF2934 domain-containing protein [Chloroflexota bacterium]